MTNTTLTLHENDSASPNDREVYDEADQASMIQMAENEKALAKIKAKFAPEIHPDFDGKSCVDCGDKIPKPRLLMGKVRCVHCQGAIEARQKFYAKDE